MDVRTMVATLAIALGSAVTLSAGAPPASAVGCYGTACDNLGPQANGCFNDDKVLGQGGGSAIQLRYSDACHAMWAYGPVVPLFWPVDLFIEMQWKNNAGNWVWATPPRLHATFEPNGGPDWTNALGSRTTRFRFRAVYSDPMDGTFWATPWGLGGNR